ncbi:MAG: NAD-dependent epimerase/dehydratase family protein [Fimbriimonas sp.]
MDILVLGGTVFVGRHFVAAALAAGHRVTLVHRGQRGAELFPEAERILADRDGGLDALGNRSWDAVVDCCGYVPRIVAQSVEALKDRVDRYLFVSTISVYRDPSIAGMDEEAPIFASSAPGVEEVTGETYGPMKVGCEDAVRGAFGDRATIVRPGLVMGPYDPTNRFTYWVDRLARGGEALVPARPEQPMQLIDARDLGQFMLRLVERNIGGTFNACGPDTPKNLGDMIEACHCLNLGTRLVWAEPAFLEAQGVGLWSELPLILPPDGGSDGMSLVDNRRAIAEGLAFRSWEETARDTLAWVREAPPAGPPRHGLDPEKERRVLDALNLSA